MLDKIYKALEKEAEKISVDLEELDSYSSHSSCRYNEERFKEPDDIYYDEDEYYYAQLKTLRRYLEHDGVEETTGIEGSNKYIVEALQWIDNTMEELSC